MSSAYDQPEGEPRREEESFEEFCMREGKERGHKYVAGQLPEAKDDHYPAAADPEPPDVPLAARLIGDGTVELTFLDAEFPLALGEFSQEELSAMIHYLQIALADLITANLQSHGGAASGTEDQNLSSRDPGQ